MNKIEDLVPLLLDTLNNNKDFTMPVKGTSMLPFINEKNLVTLTKPNNIKKNDIVFYKRNNGQYVLHRIYQIKKDYFVLMGDNQTFKEEPIYLNQIIAKVKSIKKKNKIHYLKGFKYKLYLFFWHNRLIRKIFFPITRGFFND